MKVRVLAKPQVNELITDEAFEIEFPDGTEIRDSAHSSNYRTGGKPQLDNDTRTKIGDAVPNWSFTLAAKTADRGGSVAGVLKSKSGT